MPTNLVEGASGAQILPVQKVRDERALTSAWAAHLACGADERRHPAYRELAQSLHVRPEDDQ